MYFQGAGMLINCRITEKLMNIKPLNNEEIVRLVDMIESGSVGGIYEAVERPQI